MAFAIGATALTIVAQPAAATTPPSPTLSIIAGTGVAGPPTQGPAINSALDTPNGLAVDAAGNVYIADTNNNRVEKVTVGGTLSIIAGNGAAGLPTQGPAINSQLNGPGAVAVDAAGNVYIADTLNNLIEKVTPGGTLSIIAGTGTPGAPTQGPALNSRLSAPYGITVDAAGNLYVADTGNQQIEKVTPGGTLSFIAGNGSQGAPTSGGPALSSRLNGPSGVVLDAAGNIYIADWGNYQVERVTPGGTLSIIAGNGTSGSPTAGPATSSQLGLTNGLAVDAAGNVYIADSGDVVEMVTPGGTLSIIAGTGVAGPPTPGPAAASRLYWPDGVAIDGAGNLYIADMFNHQIEKVTFPAVPSAPIGVTASAGNGSATLTWNAPVSNGNVPITGYDYSADGGTTWTRLTYTGTGPFAATVTGLANGRTYPIQIRAVNEVGNGAGSTTLSVTPVAPVIPSPTPIAPTPVTPKPVTPTPIKPTPPKQLRAATSDAGLTITFTPATAATGSRITSYQVSVNGGRTWTATRTTGTSRLTTTVTGLQPGTTYRIKVRALTNHGLALPSATITATMPKAWYVDPISNRSNEALVPANPAAYYGPVTTTIAADRSYDGTVAVLTTAAKGHRLTAHQAVTLPNNGLFAFDSPVITAAGALELRQLVASLVGDKAITCEGYTDYGNQIAHEYQLSTLRAQAVCAALKSYGATTSMQATGYGSTRPVTIGGTPADRAANRRVVIYINN